MTKWPVILSLMGCAILASDALPVSQKDLVNGTESTTADGSLLAVRWFQTLR